MGPKWDPISGTRYLVPSAVEGPGVKGAGVRGARRSDGCGDFFIFICNASIRNLTLDYEKYCGKIII